MGMLRVLSRSGDDKYSWSTAGVEVGDPEALAAVREAERIFEEQRSHGHTRALTEGQSASSKISRAAATSAISKITEKGTTSFIAACPA